MTRRVRIGGRVNNGAQTRPFGEEYSTMAIAFVTTTLIFSAAPCAA